MDAWGSAGLSRQPAKIFDRLDDLIHAFPMLHLSKEKRPLAAHFGGVPVHDLEARAHHVGEVRERALARRQAVRVQLPELERGEDQFLSSKKRR